MTDSQHVIDALVRDKNPARVGLSGGPWVDTLVLWMEEGYPTRKVYREAGEERPRFDPRDAIRDGRPVVNEVSGEYEEPVPVWHHFRQDMIGVGPWFDAWPLGVKARVSNHPRGKLTRSQLSRGELIEDTEEWQIIRNGAGATMRWWKHKGGTPEHLGYRMVSREIWERHYRPHLLDLDPERISVEEMRKNLADARVSGLWTSMSHMFVWEQARQSMGDLCLYESLLLDPEWIHDYNRVYTDFHKKHWAYVFEHVGLPDSVTLCEDLGYNAGPFASPKTFEELVFPYFREIVDFFHGYGVAATLHTCGSTAAVMPLILEAGFDAVNPMERKALHTDPFVFAEKYGERIVLQGGLDMRVLETNDKEIIGREVANLVEGMKARGARFILSPDHGITPNVRYESWLHAVQVYREHMWY